MYTALHNYKTGLSSILNTNIPNDGDSVFIGQNRFNGIDPYEARPKNCSNTPGKTPQFVVNSLKPTLNNLKSTFNMPTINSLQPTGYRNELNEVVLDKRKNN